MTFLYKADPARGRIWAATFAAVAPALPFRIWPDIGDPADVRFLAAWEPPEALVERFPNLQILFSAGAGVDQFDLATLPEHLPLVRLIEPGIVNGMVEYVSWATLALHRDMFEYRRQQLEHRWQAVLVQPAANRRVGVMGMGSLGQAVAGKLRDFGFTCAGWSRRRAEVEGVRCFAGDEELPAFLERTDILVCLLPLTPRTHGILNLELFSQLPAGASLIHVGRGPHLIVEDLFAALDAGMLKDVVMDVTDPEPLPADSRLWRHPRVCLTPHIASMTQPESGAMVVLDNLRRFRAGEPLNGLVDRRRGY